MKNRRFETSFFKKSLSFGITNHNAGMQRIFSDVRFLGTSYLLDPAWKYIRFNFNVKLTA